MSHAHPGALQPDGYPPNPHPSKPTLALPPGVCDSHCHIFGPFSRFPLPPDRNFTPNEAPETALRKLHGHLGIDRAVIVHSQGHGFDYRPMLEALASGQGRYRGVAVLKPSTPASDVACLDAGGVCGVRFNFLAHLGGRPNLDDVRTIIELTQPFAWHVAIHVAGADLLDYAEFLGSIQRSVVIDHMARPDVAEGSDGPTVTALKRLLDSGRVWVKVSGVERLSKIGPPYRDATPIAASLVRHAPDRALWGTDWPHVNLHGPMPDDGVLVDLLAQIAPEERTRHRILVDNPVSLFGF